MGLTAAEGRGYSGGESKVSESNPAKSTRFPEVKPMRRSIFGAVSVSVLALCLCVATVAPAQMLRPGMARPGTTASVGGGGASSGIRLRGEPKGVPEKTPLFKVSASQQNSSTDPWWHGVIEFETAAEWTDEVEFTWYCYVDSPKEGKKMFRSTAVYVNIPKGKHNADAFLNPNAVKRYGRPKYTAVVVKVNGAEVDKASDLNQANWWTQLTPVDGVLLNRALTPFSVLDYDLYPNIKPTVPAR
jgi:hypothetical protein